MSTANQKYPFLYMKMLYEDRIIIL